jgi:glycosyltransferase involved in cell wall biosynthesis
MPSLMGIVRFPLGGRFLMKPLRSSSLSIVVPCYKSADCLDALAAAIKTALTGKVAHMELILVDDGSPDGGRTWTVIQDLTSRYNWVRGIQHRRNFGQDATTITGLRHIHGDFVIVMDDDLQHDPNDIPALLSTIQNGDHDVVYAVFDESKYKLWKRLGSWFNGKVAEWLINKPPLIYLSSFKIIRGEVAREVTKYSGPFPYVDSLLLQLTNRLSQVSVQQHERFAGTSNYTFRISVQRWARMAFSLSLSPLRLSMWGGVIFSLLGLGCAVAVILYRLFIDKFSDDRAGWASLMVTILTLGGLQMIFIGILGEYVGRSHITIQQAPQSTIAQMTPYDETWHE